MSGFLLGFFRGLIDGYSEAMHGRSVGLAVTGLSRAGKTVFLTSLAQNLLCAGASARGTGGAANLAAFTPLASGALRNVMLEPAGHRNRPHFPFEECLNALSSDSPAWPKRTGAVSEIELRFQFGPASATDRQQKTTGEAVFRGVDYPGEWLLDLPLLGQSFGQWAARTIELSREGSREKLSEQWRALISDRNVNDPNEDAFCRQAAEQYQSYLVACRKHGLRFLQPGRFLRFEGQDDSDPCPQLDRPQLWFCPLPPAPDGSWASGSIGAAMADRYRAYSREGVHSFFHDNFSSFRRQLVLVDVLGALTSGREVFEDTCRALAEVCKYLRSTQSLIDRLLRLPAAEKIAFAATKADHVPRLQRENLARLLEGMLRNQASASMWQGSEFLATYLSSICCTEEERAEFAGGARDAVVGRLMSTGKRAKVVVKPIPAEVPDRAYWQGYEQNGIRAFDYPTFMPPPINPGGNDGIPQIGMERLLNFLIADQLE